MSANTWRHCRLGDVAKIRAGYGFPPALQGRSGGDFPFAKVGDISEAVRSGTTELSTSANFVDASDLAALRARPIPAESVVFAKIGEAIRLNRRVITTRPMLVDNNVMALEPDKAQLDPRFLLQFMRTINLYELASATTVPSLRASDIADIQVHLPSLREQRRIVAKLDALQARSRRAREALDAIPPLLEKLRQSILAAAFRGDLTREWRAKNPDVEPASVLLKRIRVERRAKWEEAELAKMVAKGKPPKDDKWKAKYVEPKPVDTSGLPELPAGWCWASWSEVGFSQNGRPFPSSQYTSLGVRLLRPGNLHASGRVIWTEENTRLLPESFAAENRDLLVGPNELIMNLTAQSLKDQFLGRLCLTNAPELCLLNQRLARLAPISLDPELVLWMFKSPIVRSQIDVLNTGSLIQHMFTSQVERFHLPIPPAAEQRVILAAIAAEITRVDATVGHTDTATSKLAGLDRAALSRAFRGELVAQDPSDEPMVLPTDNANAAPAPAGTGRQLPSSKRARARPPGQSDGEVHAGRPIRLLTVGAEGGKLDVLGRLVEGAWRFRVITDSRTLAMFDPSLEGMPLYDESEWTADWEEIVQALDRDSCWNLYAKKVDPAIAPQVQAWLDARKVDREALAQWKRVIAEGGRH